MIVRHDDQENRDGAPGLVWVVLYIDKACLQGCVPSDSIYMEDSLQVPVIRCLICIDRVAAPGSGLNSEMFMLVLMTMPYYSLARSPLY